MDVKTIQFFKHVYIIKKKDKYTLIEFGSFLLKMWRDEFEIDFEYKNGYNIYIKHADVLKLLKTYQRYQT